jgi:hypothetical protein
LFSYDPETGDLTRRVACGQRGRAGAIVGTLNEPGGYLRVVVDASSYYVHCIIWKMMKGRDPAVMVDHEDGNKLNNRWTNLRLATNGENICNSRLRRDNRSGVKGVIWEADRERWLAYITVNGRNTKIGRFESLAKAKGAIIAARIRLHGEFSRVA